MIAVDDSDKYLAEFTSRLNRYNIREQVTFVQKDAVNLNSVISSGVANMVVGYRLLEELRRPENMDRMVEEMARMVKKGVSSRVEHRRKKQS